MTSNAQNLVKDPLTETNKTGIRAKNRESSKGRLSEPRSRKVQTLFLQNWAACHFRLGPGQPGDIRHTKIGHNPGNQLIKATIELKTAKQHSFLNQYVKQLVKFNFINQTPRLNESVLHI